MIRPALLADPAVYPTPADDGADVPDRSGAARRGTRADPHVGTREGGRSVSSVRGMSTAAPAPACDLQSPLLTVSGLTVRYGTTVALHGLDLIVNRGELFVLLGASGSGKTTLLRAIAGFVQPDAGHIELDGTELARLPPHRRPVNTMFQSYALFPHMSVAANIGFGLRQQRRPRAEIAARVAEMLALVRLEGFAARRPHQFPAASSNASRWRAPGAQSAAAVARRAAVGAGSQPAHRNARRTGAAATASRHQLHPGDARPGGGTDDGRPHRRDAGRAPGAGRYAGRGL